MQALIVIVVGALLAMSGAQDEPIHIGEVGTCLEDRKIAENFSADLRINPYYLRGDFDGDGLADYAIAIKGRKGQKGEVLVCTAKSQRIVLTNESLSPDHPKASVFSSLWRVATKQEVLELRKAHRDLPIPTGESIEMVWEDGMHFIYWDGKRFRMTVTLQ